MIPAVCLCNVCGCWRRVGNDLFRFLLKGLLIFLYPPTHGPVS